MSRTRQFQFIGVGALVLAGAGWALLAAARKPAYAPVEQRRWVEVEHVRRGDALVVKPADKLLYAGIRAPFPEEPLYKQSLKRNAELVEQKQLRLRFDQTERDKKGRLLAYAFAGGETFVNETLVREGLAFVRLTASNRRYADQLLTAQQEARRKKRGIWRTTFKSVKGAVTGDPKYGNFHIAGCEELAKKDPARMVEYRNVDEAFAQGFAPCRKCCPYGGE